MGKKERLVVIGNGMAGVATVEHVLTKKKDMSITILGSEPYTNYNRVLLSSVLSGEAGLDEIILNPQKWYEENGIELHLGVTVKKINKKEKSVITNKGDVYSFDKLLIAIGSNAFIPSIKGMQNRGNLNQGIFTFRNLDDAKSMISWAQKCRKAIVIGGGLLGLEAARGLIHQGVEVTVVHLMDRLMDMQLDAAAAAILKKEINKLGINVLLEHCADKVIGNGSVEGLRFTNGKVYQADMIVIATGIRPNVELAREASLDVNHGIVVNDYMQSSNPDIYAVGECAEHRGKVYGIVAPLMEQAKVAADAIAGNFTLRYEGSVVATKLKVAGIPLASIGNFYEESTGCEALVYSDPGASLYKKAVIQGGRVVGAIFLGELDEYNRFYEYIKNREDITLHRKYLLTGQPSAITSVASMLDSATVCGCMGVSKGAIVKAIEEDGLTSKQEISEKTKACTSCKGCAPLIDQILQDVLGGEYVKHDGPQWFCECIPMTWDDIRKEVIARGLKSVSEILHVLGSGQGCETCKPGLNYMLSELYINDYKIEDDACFIDDKYYANIQKDETFSVVPRIYGGVTNPDQLSRIADVADKYHVPLVKITGGQRIDLVGISGELLSSVWTDLGMPSGHAYAKAVRTCKTCVGETFCRFGVQDSMTFGIEMEQRYQGIPSPAKIKMAVSGCPRNCAESSIKDIGVVGIHTGWEIYIGGNGGIKSKVAELLTVVNTREEVLDLTGVFIQYYRENARWLERTSQFIERVGIEHIREVIIVDKLGIVDRLRKRINQVIAAYKDPWLNSQQSDEKVHLVSL
ncbi:MAG: NAD(P)/FAD-dependent oxidoreductase [Nitrospirae bacterium]|nr:NAD(P)/FAD-dependent oxidoreductase [Nitrospirota bacterium]